MDVFLENIATKLGLQVREKSHRDALYMFIKCFRRHSVGQDIVTQCDYIATGVPLVRCFTDMKDLQDEWMVVPAHPALLVKLEVGPALARSLIRSVESAEAVVLGPSPPSG